MKNKVFCIGFQKTGTTSMNDVFRTLGYNPISTRFDLSYKVIKEDFETIMDILSHYDSCEDTPWPILYKQMDERFPDAKFILTVRDSGDWIGSMKRFFGDGYTAIREHIYGEGIVIGNDKVFIERYEKHNQDVIEHFKGREHKLLVTDITKDNNWSTICNFLNVPIPNIPFPHKNKS